ncbi:hypothetical protein LTR56_000950 [Elasticomyces elasticus]|nr:hypothetical protein LTR56_000950 [Elasticomyces elasticus]KAK3665524.1 hypothetical protein LTR22_003754 [Elasticomyces elasticus]KAK4929833.1 hypothetical protein LTR49_003460 [Elasticomyces elasticus]KAK5759466.1 hypothetical protein LTS12_010479 [Elasticomyces elasticus]
MATATTAPTQYIQAPNNTTFAYRRLGPHNVIPLVLHIHFRANMDFWDPLLIDTLIAQGHPVIIFDQSGVGKSSGHIATTYQAWAENVIAFVTALGLTKIDLLGFSMGGCCVQMVALTRPDLVRRLIIAGSGPSVPCKRSTEGIVWPRDEPPRYAITTLSTGNGTVRSEIEEGIRVSFFSDSKVGHEAAGAYFDRIYTRTPSTCGGETVIHDLLDTERTAEQRKAYVDWSTPNPQNSFDRLGELNMPVLVLNGDDDLLIPTSRSWELVRGIPDAQLIIYPQAGHGFVWQYAKRVAEDIGRFLDSDLGHQRAKL